MVAVLDSAAVLAAVGPAEAVDVTERAFLRHGRGEWEMPAKVYLDSPPHGDFRAMPARGGGYASLKWVTSFPHNPDRGLPVVTGALLLSGAESGELLAILDCAAITSLRTGAAAALSARTLARSEATSVGIVGCGVNGGWAARCLAAIGYGRGVCCDLEAGRAGALAEELGWEVGARSEAVACDVVVTVTPGERPVIERGELRPGSHVAALGADGAGKAELGAEAIAELRLFCDEWRQAASGGELAGPVERGEVQRERVTELGAVLLGEAPGRESEEEITLFDSTGLAIQDLGVAIAVYEAWRRGEVEAREIAL